MNFDKVSNYIRMIELAGRGTVTAKDVDNISEDVLELTEEELNAVPYNRKRLIENKVHVLDWDNKLVLKPVNLKDIEDKNPPTLNTVKDYEKDGGDAAELNKNMVDNDDSDYGDDLNEDAASLPYREDQIKQAKELLDKKRSKLRQAQLSSGDKTGKSRKELEDEEYNELLARKKKEKEAAAALDRGRHLSLATEDAEDGTIYTGTKFSKEDEEEYLGLPEVRDIDVALPASIKADVNKRIKEIEQSIRDYDDKGYNDGAGANSNKNKAIDALEQLLDNLQSADYEGFREAQLFFLTLMSPITDLFPASLVNFLSTGPEPEGRDEIMTKVEPHETELKEEDSHQEDATTFRSLNDIIQESKKKRKRK